MDNILKPSEQIGEIVKNKTTAKNNLIPNAIWIEAIIEYLDQKQENEAAELLKNL